MFHRHVAPRGRIGERPPRFVSESGHQFSASGVRLPVFGFGAGLTDQEARTPVPFLACGGRQVTSGWAPYRLGCTTAFTTLLFRPIPVRRNLCAWDCKVTPASCTCQEGNTIGCIPSNDRLDAGSGPCFPHCGKHGSLRFVDELAKFPFWDPIWRQWLGLPSKETWDLTCASSHQAHVLGRTTAIAKRLRQFPANSSCVNVREESIPASGC